MPGLLKSVKLWEDVTGKSEISIVHRGNLVKPDHSDSSLSLYFRRYSFPAGVGRHLSHKGFMSGFRGRSESP